MRLAGGRIAVLDATLGPLYDEQGRFTQIVGSGVDVTDRVQTEVALLESEERFRSMIDGSPVPCALNDNQQNILYVNPAFVRAFGWELTDIPTLSDWWPRAYPDADYRQLVAQDWQVRLVEVESSGRPFAPAELKVRAKNGSDRTVLASASRLSDSYSGIHLVTLFDISDRIDVERRLRVQEERLRLASAIGEVGVWD